MFTGNTQHYSALLLTVELIEFQDKSLTLIYFLARALVSKDKGHDWYFSDVRVRSKRRCYLLRAVTVQV